MSFEINNTINVNSASKQPRLAANEIHKNVVLKEVTVDDMEGKDGTKYETIYLKFEGENGAIHEHRFFKPMETEAIIDGKFGKQASDNTQFMYSILHLIEALNPNLYQQIKDGKKFSVKTWKEMRIWVVSALTAGIDVPKELKLVSDSKGYATLPKYPVSVSKNGELYMKTTFIGENLSFTKYEQQTIDAQKKAMSNGPSKMKDVDFEVSTPKSTGDSFDI